MPIYGVPIKKCKYSYNDYMCPFEAMPAKDLCIFHLPVQSPGNPVVSKQAEHFWRHFASYYIALLENSNNDEGVKKFLSDKSSRIFNYENRAIVDDYISKIEGREKWEFIGFQFPRMVETYNLSNLIFLDADFTRAKFNRDIDFSKSKFKENTYFKLVEFSGDVTFFETIFMGETDFTIAQFVGDVSFWGSIFYDIVDFLGTKFSGKLDFRETFILKLLSFYKVQFLREVDFTNSIIKFIDFEQSEISSFLRIRELQRSLVDHGFQIPEQSRLLVGGNIPPIILLRDLRFWENGHLLLEDFNVSRISFWHTNFYVIRPRIDFVRVDWGEKKIIIDDIISRPEYKTYKEKKNSETLTYEELRMIYEQIDNSPNKYEGIEQCYRQIRLNYEAGGEHPDAGDFYLSEMKARGKRLKETKNKKFIRFLHWLYGIVSNYGESPQRALKWFVRLWLFCGIIYLYTGFNFSSYDVRYQFRFDFSHPFNIVSDYLFKAIWYSVINMIPGYFKFANQTGQSMPTVTTIISIIESILGISVLTLFLLAVRRRFRRESN